MFDYAIKRHVIQFNPASAFDVTDAGGEEEARELALSRDELVTLSCVQGWRQQINLDGRCCRVC